MPIVIEGLCVWLLNFRKLWSSAFQLLLNIMLLISAAQAQSMSPVAGETPVPTQNLPAGTGNTLWQRGNLLGDPENLHQWLQDHGLSPSLTVATEVLRNTQGGYERATHLQAEAVFVLGLDTNAAFGWPGGRFYTSLLAIGGGGVSIDGVGSLTTISSIEAERSFRLFELWYEQSFLRDRASLRIGQLAVDQEFLTTGTGSVFLNADFGWPTLASINLPAGGPAYPLATPGMRVRFSATPAIALLAGLFNGNPAPAGYGDPQRSNAIGTNFRLDGGAFGIVEGQWSHDFHVGDQHLPGTYKIGAWWNTNSFFDQHRDPNGLSLANLNSTGFPALHRNNWSFFAAVDQVLWRRSHHTDDGLSSFLRIMSGPDDRNQVSVELDGGLAWRGLIAARPNDTFGVAFGWFKVSQAARALDRDIVALGLPRPVRSAEGMIEATYQAAIAPWFQIQPDIQYIVRPGGGVPGGDGRDSLSRPLGNSAIVALRTTITF